MPGNPKNPAKPFIKGTPQIVVDPKVPPKLIVDPKPVMRTKSGVPNGPTVGKVYKTY